MPHHDIWIPDAPFAKPAASPNVKEMDHREMMVVRAMHRIGQKHEIVLACARCRRPFQGLNSPLDSTESIECGCRELRATKPAAEVAQPPSTLVVP